MNKKKALLALLLAFSMNTGIAYADGENAAEVSNYKAEEVTGPKAVEDGEKVTATYNGATEEKANKAEPKDTEEKKANLTEENVAERIQGADRFETAAKVQNKFFKDADEAVLASSEVFVDAISASNITDGEKPILYTQDAKLNEKTAKQIKESNIKKVQIIGGTKRISKEVEETLKKSGIEVERIDGANRYEVNAKLAAHKKNPDTLIFASGEDYADGLSSVGLANKTNAPILLVQSDKVPTPIRDYLNSIDKSKII
ncbi:MAG: cell wall-binding repeat-containing protein [Finegoldia sp.]|nr:cell wall-binding repeat-containing protein [Finegoldia sp.]